eukprot:4699165-Pyramimonas_sp.AAC.1
MNRFGDTIRVRLSNPELGTRSAARARFSKLFKSISRHEARPPVAFRGLRLVSYSSYFREALHIVWSS